MHLFLKSAILIIGMLLEKWYFVFKRYTDCVTRIEMISLSLVHIEVLCGQLYMNSVKNTSTLKTVNFALHGFY